MKQIILKYNLELFSAIILCILMIRFLFFPELSMEHRLLSAFMIMAILHEFEEKRTPGGFYELMFKKLGVPDEKQDFNKPALCVTIYWSVMLLAASLFPRPALLMALSCLGLFEAFIHTAGIRIHRLKKPYTPGLVTAWIMAFVSVITIRFLDTDAVCCITGFVIFIISFLCLGISNIRSLGMTPGEIRRNMFDR